MVELGLAIGFKMVGLLRLPVGDQLIVAPMALVLPCRVADCPGAMITSGPASTPGFGVTMTVMGVR